MNGAHIDSLCEETFPERGKAPSIPHIIPREIASQINPLISENSTQGTLIAIGEVVSAIGYAMSSEEAADVLAPQFWRLGLLAKASLHYEANAMPPQS